MELTVAVSTAAQLSVSSFALGLHVHLPNFRTQLSQASGFSKPHFSSFSDVACNSFSYLSAKLLSAHTTLSFTFCLHFRHLCAFVDSGMAGRPPQRTINVRESMLADATKAHEDSLAAVMSADPYAYGTPSCQAFRAKARQQWKDFREIILEKESVFQRRQLLDGLLTHYH